MACPWESFLAPTKKDRADFCCYDLKILFAQPLGINFTSNNYGYNLE